jgi:hypothetical protein
MVMGAVVMVVVAHRITPPNYVTTTLYDSRRFLG